MIDIAQLIGEDLYALFLRALLNQTINAFGEDGCGKYGRNPFAQQYKVLGIKVDVFLDIDDKLDAFLYLKLDQYDLKQGYMYTDKNALLSTQNLLEASLIDRASISWAPLIFQKDEDHICFVVDVKKLNI